MGYDISIYKFKNKDEDKIKEFKIANEDNSGNDGNSDNEGKIDNKEYPFLSDLGYDELRELTEEVATLYMTYNHCQLFQEYDIYPRYFNDKKVKDILPAYMDAFNKLFNDEEVDKELAREYQDFNFSSKYMDVAYCDSRGSADYLYEKSKTAIFVVIKAVIKLLIECDPDDIWLSD
jgi:hypothetical protein